MRESRTHGLQTSPASSLRYCRALASQTEEAIHVLMGPVLELIPGYSAFLKFPDRTALGAVTTKTAGRLLVEGYAGAGAPWGSGSPLTPCITFILKEKGEILLLVQIFTICILQHFCAFLL